MLVYRQSETTPKGAVFLYTEYRIRKKCAAKAAHLILLVHFLQSVLAGEVCTALLVEAHELDPSHVAQVQNVFDLFHAAVLQLGDVNHAVVAGSDLNECADGQDADNLAVVQLANLGNEADVVDDLLGSVSSGD